MSMAYFRLIVIQKYNVPYLYLLLTYYYTFTQINVFMKNTLAILFIKCFLCVMCLWLGL